MRRREEGAVAVIVAIVLVVFVAAVALAVDVGGLMLHRRGLVNSSDSAALSAARTCARGGFDNLGTPESAADHQALANSPITLGETAEPNIREITTCGDTAGHVTVGYTSQQALFFAPVLGFNHESPVHTQATASWGLGSNNAVPLVLSSRLGVGCPVPPQTPTPAIGTTCAFWYDNGRLGGGNFAFLSLDPRGWNVPIDENCSAEGTRQLTDWITGQDPESVSLNWTDPTFVCSVPGLRGANPEGPQVWSNLRARTGDVLDFPINWEGCGDPPAWCPPIPETPSQGMVMRNDTIDKYDIIGFAALLIVDVLSVNDASGTSTTTQEPFTDFTFTNVGITFGTTLPTGSVINYTWRGTRSNGDPTGGTCGPFTTNTSFGSGTLHTWRSLGGTGSGCPGNNDTLDVGQPDPPPTITVPVTTTAYGPCGPPPENSSAECLITEWRGSTLSGDYSEPLDNIRVVRLCDRDEGTCLDQ
jgi:Flp pilus assembly protein TadG